MTCHDGRFVLRDLRIRIPSVLGVSGSLPASGGTEAELADGLDSVMGTATRGVPGELAHGRLWDDRSLGATAPESVAQDRYHRRGHSHLQDLRAASGGDPAAPSPVGASRTSGVTPPRDAAAVAPDARSASQAANCSCERLQPCSLRWGDDAVHTGRYDRIVLARLGPAVLNGEHQ